MHGVFIITSVAESCLVDLLQERRSNVAKGRTAQRPQSQATIDSAGCSLNFCAWAESLHELGARGGQINDLGPSPMADGHGDLTRDAGPDISVHQGSRPR